MERTIETKYFKNVLLKVKKDIKPFATHFHVIRIVLSEKNPVYF